MELPYLGDLGIALGQNLLDDLVNVLGVELRGQGNLGRGVVCALNTLPAEKKKKGQNL